MESIAELFSLRDRVVIVTGGSRGLGASIAHAFAAAGARVVVASRRIEACREVADAISSEGGVAHAASCHMGDDGAVRALVATTVERYGRLDCVVNNAATPLRLGVTGFDSAMWQKSLDVNLRGPLVLIAAAVPHLALSDQARVINVLSVGGQRGSISLLGYGSAKAALRHATEAIAAELAPKGILVNAIVPGPFKTRMMNASDDEFRNASTERTLLKRMAEPDEIVGAALFLAGRAASFVTGSCVTVDGGLLA